MNHYKPLVILEKLLRKGKSLSHAYNIQSSSLYAWTWEAICKKYDDAITNYTNEFSMLTCRTVYLILYSTLRTNIHSPLNIYWIVRRTVEGPQLKQQIVMRDGNYYSSAQANTSFDSTSPRDCLLMYRSFTTAIRSSPCCRKTWPHCRFCCAHSPFCVRCATALQVHRKTRQCWFCKK